MGTNNFQLMIIFLSLLLSTTTEGGKLSDNCFDSCMNLLRETLKDANNKECPDKTESLYEETHSCQINCENASTSSFGNDTVSFRGQNLLSIPTSPSLYESGHNYITLKWNTTQNAPGTVAFYILQIEQNFTHRHNSLTLSPSIPRYLVVTRQDSSHTQTHTVENLANGYDYRFRVAAVGLNANSSEYSSWSPWYSTNSDCNRTRGFVSVGLWFNKRQERVFFPCSVSQVTLNVSIKARYKKPVVLDAHLNWKYPRDIHDLKNQPVQVTVELVEHEDENIHAMCAHYHDTNYKETIQFPTNQTSVYLPSRQSPIKKSIHFGCSYAVKFEVLDADSPNSFESSTIFRIPDCLQNFTSCPVPNTMRKDDGNGITEKVFHTGTGNSSYAANISWDASEWMKSHKIDFFHVLLIEEKSRHSGKFYQIEEDVPAKDGVTNYHIKSYNMSAGKQYIVVVRAYHGSNCLHDIIKEKKFQIQEPCPQGCQENATCFPADTFDGTANCRCKAGYIGNGTICAVKKRCSDECPKNAECVLADDGVTTRCKCKVGYTGNGTLCTVIEPRQLHKEAEKDSKVLAIVLPVSFILALAAVILAFLSWRIKRKKQLMLTAFEARESAISPSSSNSNLYQSCPPRYNPGEAFAKVNEVELEEKEVNVIYVPQEIQDAISNGLTDGYEFNAEMIKFEECLGKGAFGYVHRARALGVTAEPEWTLVAVKTLSEPVTEKSVEDFIAEIELMKRLGDHENIIQMLGCCTLTLPICLIMEFAPYGNLLTYLRAAKKTLQLENDAAKANPVSEKELTESSVGQENLANEQELIEKTLTFEENHSPELEVGKLQLQSLVEDNTYLQSFALQIAKGMAYVAGLGIVHRDLAARNILIGKDYQLKISDFGLSKEGIYVKSTSGKIPLRWLSIEAIRERTYSSASDVWSYGIVLWEICTLGDFPYPSKSDRELLKFLVSGERLEKPSNCTDEMYKLMLECWQAAPEDRPTFAHLRDVLWKKNTGENPYINIDPIEDDLCTNANKEGNCTEV